MDVCTEHGRLVFGELGPLTNKPPESLMHMFGPDGNPHARNLFEVISRIQQQRGV